MAHNPDRYDAVAHIVRILRLIRAEPRTRAELGEAIGVHERTVRRLIEALETAGVKITDKRRGHDGGPLEYSTRVKI